jgi:hypothetical protein
VKSPVQEAPPWSRRRWFWTVGLAMAVQVLLVFSLSDRSLLRKRQASLDMTTYHVDPRRASPALIELQSLSDPLLYALPSVRGFAGAGWRDVAEFSPPPLEWEERPRWLANSTQALGQVLSARLLPATAGDSIRSRKPPPRLGQVAVPPLPLAAQSGVRIEGDLARRGFQAPLPVPSIVHSNLLTNTVVHLWVKADGEPFSAVVLRSSGLKSADGTALALATSARFNPDPAGERNAAGLAGCWGELVFQWHIVGVPPVGVRQP